MTQNRLSKKQLIYNSHNWFLLRAYRDDEIHTSEKGDKINDTFGSISTQLQENKV